MKQLLIYKYEKGVELPCCYWETNQASGLRKQLTFCDNTSNFPTKWDTRKGTYQILYGWRITSKIWVMLLIGWSKFRPQQGNQNHHPDLGSDM